MPFRAGYVYGITTRRKVLDSIVDYSVYLLTTSHDTNSKHLFDCIAEGFKLLTPTSPNTRTR
jgi:hypothetical protein